MASTAEQLRYRRALAKSAGVRVARRKLPLIKYPAGARLRYHRELRAIIANVEVVVKNVLRPELESIIKLADFERGGRRADTSVDLITRTFQRMRLLLGAGVTDERIEEFVAGLAGEVNVFNRRETQRQFKAVLGIEMLEAETALEATLRSFIRTNADIMKEVPDQLIGALEREVLDGVDQGLRVEEIAKRLEDRFRISTTRAAFVARDRVGKLNGALTQRRHENIGITEYRWSTSKDERVRPGHRRLDGLVFEYLKPPVVDERTGRRANPGQDFQCRCNAIPIFPPELLEAANRTEQPAAAR